MTRVGGRSTPTGLAGACDTHVHVFLPDRFPYAADRAYTPGTATVDQLLSFLAAHALDRVVLVLPSVYGTDNGVLVEALRSLGERARGIAVIDPLKVADAALETLGAAGVRGVRINFTTRGTGGSAELAAAAELTSQRLGGLPWALQIYAPLPIVAGAAARLARLERPLILDHFGGMQASTATVGHVGALIDLARSGPAYVKLSAAYRVSENAAAGWPDVAPLARRLVEAVPDRLIWGSDWPHTGMAGSRAGRDASQVEPFQAIDDARALRCLAEWAGSKAMLRRILVETPARLYGFAD